MRQKRKDRIETLERRLAALEQQLGQQEHRQAFAAFFDSLASTFVILTVLIIALTALAALALLFLL